MSKIDWFKRHFNFISSEKLLQLQEKYPFKGFFIYELSMSLVGLDNEYSIKKDTTKFSFLIKSLVIYTELLKEEITEILNYLIEIQIIIEENNILIFPELKKSFDDILANIQKKSDAGKKGAEAKKKKTEQLAKNKQTNEIISVLETKEVIVEKKSIEDISIMDMLEGYEESYNQDIQDKKGKELNQTHFSSFTIHPQYKEERDIFIEKCVTYFNTIAEPHYMVNKLEKKALEKLYQMINYGVFTKFQDLEGHLDDLCKLVFKKSDKSFLFTGLYNQISGEITKLAKSNPSDLWLVKGSDKFKHLSNAKELQYV